MEVRHGAFVWDRRKEWVNVHKHGVHFDAASQVFKDPKRIILDDPKHSDREQRYYCIGKVGSKVLTVRFTYSGQRVRIIGAAEWRKWRRYYEKENR